MRLGLYHWKTNTSKNLTFLRAQASNTLGEATLLESEVDKRFNAAAKKKQKEIHAQISTVLLPLTVLAVDYVSSERAFRVIVRGVHAAEKIKGTVHLDL